MDNGAHIGYSSVFLESIVGPTDRTWVVVVALMVGSSTARHYERKDTGGVYGITLAQIQVLYCGE